MLAAAWGLLLSPVLLPGWQLQAHSQLHPRAPAGTQLLLQHTPAPWAQLAVRGSWAPQTALQYSWEKGDLQRTHKRGWTWQRASVQLHASGWRLQLGLAPWPQWLQQRRLGRGESWLFAQLGLAPAPWLSLQLAAGGRSYGAVAAARAAHSDVWARRQPATRGKVAAAGDKRRLQVQLQLGRRQRAAGFVAAVRHRQIGVADASWQLQWGVQLAGSCRGTRMRAVYLHAPQRLRLVQLSLASAKNVRAVARLQLAPAAKQRTTTHVAAAVVWAPAQGGQVAALRLQRRASGTQALQLHGSSRLRPGLQLQWAGLIWRLHGNRRAAQRGPLLPLFGGNLGIRRKEAASDVQVGVGLQGLQPRAWLSGQWQARSWQLRLRARLPLRPSGPPMQIGAAVACAPWQRLQFGLSVAAVLPGRVQGQIWLRWQSAVG